MVLLGFRVRVITATCQCASAKCIRLDKAPGIVHCAVVGDYLLTWFAYASWLGGFRKAGAVHSRKPNKINLISLRKKLIFAEKKHCLKYSLKHCKYSKYSLKYSKYSFKIF